MVFAMTVGAVYICEKKIQKQDKYLFDNITNLYVLLIDPYVSGTITVAITLIRRKKLLSLFKDTYNLDIKFKTLGINPSYKILTVLAWSATIVIPVGQIAWIIHMYLIQQDIVDHLMWRMCFTSCYIIYNYFMTLCIGSFIIIYQRFYLLNRALMSISDNRFEVVSELLPKIKMLHYLVCETSNSFAQFSDIPILLLTVKVYVLTIACVLSFYGMLPHLHSELTVWISVYWIHFLLCVVLSELIHNEVKCNTFCFINKSNKVLFSPGKPAHCCAKSQHRFM